MLLFNSELSEEEKYIWYTLIPIKVSLIWNVLFWLINFQKSVSLPDLFPSGAMPP